MKRLCALAFALFCIATASPAFAVLGLDLFIFDPDDVGGTSARFMNNMGCDRNGAGKLDTGLVLFKLGPTTDIKSSGASITGINATNGDLCAEGAVVGFQYRPEGWCGAGAPRFNITTKDNVTHFMGCNAATKGPVDPDTGCVTATINVHSETQASPPIPVAAAGTATCVAKVGGIAIVFDEGSDVGPGFAVLDNIFIKGAVIDGPQTTP